ncbi:MAG: CoF synthetase, partial [Gelidibacter sp.]|nr:CoF synthetase [Gelidibacter sp.]
IPKCNLSSIVACSEYLNLETKKIIQDHFKTAVISRYSNAENGIFAQQKPYGSDDFYLNWASYYFEILKFDEDVPAATGELGRVVITDLFNYYMPIIRYDTGDVACQDFNENQIPVFKSIEGRKLDLIYNTKGELISSLTITGFMMKYIEVVQFQFIQEHQKKYTIKLNTTKSFNDENSLILDVKNVLGADSIIKIEYVEEVPLLDSGKRKIIINNYKA